MQNSHPTKMSKDKAIGQVAKIRNQANHKVIIKKFNNMNQEDFYKN